MPCCRVFWTRFNVRVVDKNASFGRAATDGNNNQGARLVCRANKDENTRSDILLPCMYVCSQGEEEKRRFVSYLSNGDDRLMRSSLVSVKACLIRLITIPHSR